MPTASVITSTGIDPAFTAQPSFDGPKALLAAAITEAHVLPKGLFEMSVESTTDEVADKDGRHAHADFVVFSAQSTPFEGLGIFDVYRWAGEHGFNVQRAVNGGRGTDLGTYDTLREALIAIREAVDIAWTHELHMAPGSLEATLARSCSESAA